MISASPDRQGPSDLLQAKRSDPSLPKQNKGSFVREAADRFGRRM